MDAAKEAEIQAYALALAALLYEDTKTNNPEQLKTLGGIEAAIREHMQQRVNPTVANFCLRQHSDKHRAVPYDYQHPGKNHPHRKTSHATSGEAEKPLESISGEVLFASECE